MIVLPVDIGGREFHDRAGQLLAGLLERHGLEADPELVEALVDSYLEGVKMGVVEVAAILVGYGVDARIDFDGVQLTS